MYCGKPFPELILFCSSACAMSLATMMVPERETRVRMGYFERSARTSGIGRLRLIFTTSSLSCSSLTSGRYFDGSVSSCSMKIPSFVIFASAWRSALHETPMATGQEAPCRGNRMTRTSWQKYLPPNWAPIPISWLIFLIFSSISRSRKARPSLLPVVWRVSMCFVLAYFTVFSVISALRPPMAIARWYGGHAAVPKVFIWASRKAKSFSGVSNAFVCW
mmetsp:Transcript_32903/g.93528  ORF Transcript_32903/g.93528 Transcript_32903/m.93528 type:complete len:219 (-) Transcript_32903:743-1399(-)